MKKTIITSAFLFVLAIISTSAFAQRHNGPNAKSHEKHGQKGDKIEIMIEALDLNASQADQIKMLQNQKVTKIKPIKNELREKEARLITVSTVSEPNEKEVAKIVNEISSLKGEISLIKSMNQLEVRSLLNDEQKIKYDQMVAKKGKRKSSKH